MTNEQSPILVLGGTGKTGCRVVERLRACQLPVRIGSRSGEPPFEWEDRSTWGPALEGAAAAYVSSCGHELEAGPNDVRSGADASSGSSLWAPSSCCAPRRSPTTEDDALSSYVGEMAESFTDLRDAPVLTGVGDGPQRAAREWQRLRVRRELARFDPVVVSSLAAGLDVDGSDLDVVCDLRQPGFVERARAAYGTRHGFAAWTTDDRTVVTFFGEELQVELVGEARPVEAQSAYRHAVAQRRLVEIGGGALAARVRQLRRDFALKTEPALATALDLAGDPYKTIARLGSAPTAELERLVARQFPPQRCGRPVLQSPRRLRSLP